MDEWPKYVFFFQLPKQNKYCFGGELDPAPQVIKVQNWSFVGLNAVSQFMPQRLQDVIKKQKQKWHASTEIRNTCT